MKRGGKKSQHKPCRGRHREEGGESSAWIISLHHVNVSAGQQPIHPNKTKDVFIFIILKEEALRLRRGSFSQFSCIISFLVHKRFVDSLIAIVMVILSWKRRQRCRMASRMACPDCLYLLSNTASSSSPPHTRCYRFTARQMAVIWEVLR